VSPPLTHATVRGFAFLRTGFQQERDAPMWVRACDGEQDIMGSIDEGRLLTTIPTCPACAVLRDAALEGRTLEAP
jgi:hypothetical protein